MKNQKPLTIRQQMAARLMQAFVNKEITARECLLPIRLFMERDHYARNPYAKMRPGFFDRENEVAEILRKIGA